MTSTPILKGQIFGLPLFTAVCLSVPARPATVFQWNDNRLEVDAQDMIFNPEQAYVLLPYNPAIKTASDEPDTNYSLPKTSIPAFQMMTIDDKFPQSDLTLLNDGKLAFLGFHDENPYPFKPGKPYMLAPFHSFNASKARRKMMRLMQVFH